MRIATRVKAMETKLLPIPNEPPVLIVLEDHDGTWHDGRGTIIDRATVGSMVRVIVWRERAYGLGQTRDDLVGPSI